MDEFDTWLLQRGIDCVGMTAELRAALVRQWQAEQRSQEPPAERIVIVDSVDGQWNKALRVPVGEVLV